MEALGEALAAIFLIVIEVTMRAIAFVFHLGFAVFSPRYRAMVREEWNASVAGRVAIVFGSMFSLLALIFAIYLWTPIFFEDEPSQQEKDSRTRLALAFSGEDQERIMKTKEIDELVEVGSEIILRRLEEKSAESGKPAEK